MEKEVKNYIFDYLGSIIEIESTKENLSINFVKALYTAIVAPCKDIEKQLPWIIEDFRDRRLAGRNLKASIGVNRVCQKIFNSAMRSKRTVLLERVFVYGTLKSDEKANSIISDGYGKNREGDGQIFGAELYTNDDFQILVFSDSKRKIVNVEVYLVPKIILISRLDQYMNYPTLYQKKLVKIKDGRIGWVYYQENKDSTSLVKYPKSR